MIFFWCAEVTIMCDTQGRGKKDAKQVSAAAVLEMLLVNVPESDFLMPGKAKQTKTVQVGQMIFLQNVAAISKFGAVFGKCILM